MAGKVNYAVSMTPISTKAAVGGQSAAHDIINTDIGKSLGGSADVACSLAHTTVGYAGGTVAYASAIANGGAKTQLGADNTVYDFIIIKHTGFAYSSATELGDVTTEDLIVYREYSAGNWAQISTIPPGGAIVLCNTAAVASTGWWVESSSSGTIATEYALIT